MTCRLPLISTMSANPDRSTRHRTTQEAIVATYAVENVADPDQTIAKTVRTRKTSRSGGKEHTRASRLMRHALD